MEIDNFEKNWQTSTSSSSNSQTNQFDWHNMSNIADFNIHSSPISRDIRRQVLSDIPLNSSLLYFNEFTQVSKVRNASMIGHYCTFNYYSVLQVCNLCGFTVDPLLLWPSLLIQPFVKQDSNKPGVFNNSSSSAINTVASILNNTTADVRPNYPISPALLTGYIYMS